MRYIPLALGAVLFIVIAGLTGCGGSSYTSPNVNSSAQLVVAQDTVQTSTVKAGVPFGIDVVPVTRGGIVLDPNSIRFFKGNSEVTPEKVDDTGKSGEIYIFSELGSYTVTANYSATGNAEVQQARGTFSVVDPSTSLVWNPVIRGYTPSSTSSPYTPASVYTLSRNGDQYVADYGQKLAVDIDRTAHRGGPGDDPYAPLFKECKVVVVDSSNAEVSTRYESYYWGNSGNLPVFSAMTSGDFTAKVSIVMNNGTQRNFNLLLHVNEAPIAGVYRIGFRYEPGGMLTTDDPANLDTDGEYSLELVPQSGDGKAITRGGGSLEDLAESITWTKNGQPYVPSKGGHNGYTFFNAFPNDQYQVKAIIQIDGKKYLAVGNCTFFHGLGMVAQ